MHVPCSCSMSAGWSSHWGQLIPVRDFKDHLKKYHSGVWAHLVGSAKNGVDPLWASSSTPSSATRDLDQSQPSEVSDPGFGGQRNDVLEVLLPSPIDSSIQHQQSRRLRPLPCHPHLVGKTLTRRLLPQLDGSATQNRERISTRPAPRCQQLWHRRVFRSASTLRLRELCGSR